MVVVRTWEKEGIGNYLLVRSELQLGYKKYSGVADNSRRL